MGIRAYLASLMGLVAEQPLGDTTVIVLQWDAPAHAALNTSGMTIKAQDQHFVLCDELLQGEELHERIDLLLAEHAPCSLGEEVATEISVFWHVGEEWYKREYLSVMSCS